MGFEEFDRLAGGGEPSLDADTAKLKAIAGPRETMGEAVQADVSSLPSLADLDPTNPSNVMGLIRHGVPAAIQAALTSRLGPEAGTISKMATSGLGSVLADLFKGGENLVEGKPAGITPEGLLTSLGLGAASEGLVSGAGATGRAMTGKAGALEAGGKAAAETATEGMTAATAAGDKALQAKIKAENLVRERTAQASTEAITARETAAEKAGSAAVKGQQKALGEVEKARTALSEAEAQAKAQDQLHAESALKTVQDSEVERQISSGIGVPTTRPSDITLRDLSEKRFSPVLHSTQKRVSEIFKGASAEFEDAVRPHADNALEDNLPATVEAQRSWLLAENRHVSPGLNKKLTEMVSQGETGASTVGSHLGFRSQMVEIMRSRSASGVDKRVAGNLIEAMDKDMVGAVPNDFKPKMTVLRDYWRDLNSTFSGQFQSQLRRAGTPGKLADVLYGATSGKDAYRAANVVRQMKNTAPDELPLLRSAFAERAAVDPVGVTSDMDPAVFRELYGGTGFADPKAWAEAIRGQTTLARVMEDPQLSAKLQLAMQKGAKSLGIEKYERALQAAEDQLRKVPDPVTAIHDALRDMPTPETAANLTRQALPDPAAMTEPATAIREALRGPDPEQVAKQAAVQSARKPWGSHFTHYVKNRFLYHTVMGAALYGASGLTHHPMAMLAPMIYLGSSKAWGAALGTERGARLYYNAITSKTAESMGFYFGRLAAATLTEGVKSSADE